MSSYVQRVVEEAESSNADAVVFKINTFGGRVDAATQIKDAILNSSILTVAFIDKRAISAGALISLSCQKIVMVPGASIGATTVVDQTGKKQAEKYQSYMRGEMRSTAERNSRRADIAEGMVDERVVIEGLVDSTQLITLTSKEAIKYGIADTILSTEKEVFGFINLQDADIIKMNVTWAEEVVKFLTHPIVSSLLIMIIMVGLFTEVKTPGWGVPGTAALIALVLFFGSGYFLDLVSYIEIILFAVGVILLIVEIFVIPGFGMAGVFGVLLIVTSLFLGLISDFPIIDFAIVKNALIQFTGALVASLILFYILTRTLPKTNMWNRLILTTNINEKSGYTTTKSITRLKGKTGVALTDLRPSGAAIINNKRIDVVTYGEYIPKGIQVIVVAEEGSKVIVEELKT
jgi:membrane-bound serine protease (ClpP class)